jgi:ectoine hydroxylase-related dioxygenase (phytanoyl-CoA dioxygenase family)
MVGVSLSARQLEQYRRDGYLVLRELFAKEECDQYRERMVRLQSGAEALEGLAIDDYYHRTHNQHLYDPACLAWLIHAALRGPLEEICGEPTEAIQTMHFFQGSEHRRHQDQYYLPDAFAAWIPFEDVGARNGTIFVEPGSHRRRLITSEDVPWPAGMDRRDQQLTKYFPVVEKLSEENGIAPVLVEIEVGDVCLFHGRLIHGGATPLEQGSSRHVLGCHYIPHSSKSWDRDSPRISFDGSRRITGPDD